jgi:hypothetical protein
MAKIFMNNKILMRVLKICFIIIGLAIIWTGWYGAKLILGQTWLIVAGSITMFIGLVLTNVAVVYLFSKTKKI